MRWRKAFVAAQSLTNLSDGFLVIILLVLVGGSSKFPVSFSSNKQQLKHLSNLKDHTLSGGIASSKPTHPSSGCDSPVHTTTFAQRLSSARPVSVCRSASANTTCAYSSKPPPHATTSRSLCVTPPLSSARFTTVSSATPTQASQLKASTRAPSHSLERTFAM